MGDGSVGVGGGERVGWCGSAKASRVREIEVGVTEKSGGGGAAKSGRVGQKEVGVLKAVVDVARPIPRGLGRLLLGVL